MLWHFSANNTHLYPGALLRSRDTPGQARLAAGDTLLVEFSDGMAASGELREVTASSAILQMPAWRTRGGATVAARTWRIVPGGEPGLVSVQRRLPAT